MELHSITYLQNFEKSKAVSFSSSITKKIAVFPALSKFAVKLIC